MHLLNQKVSLVFLALLPQFVNHSSGHISLQMLILRIIFLIQVLAVFTLVSVLSEKIRYISLRSQ